MTSSKPDVVVGPDPLAGRAFEPSPRMDIWHRVVTAFFTGAATSAVGWWELVQASSVHCGSNGNDALCWAWGGFLVQLAMAVSALSSFVMAALLFASGTRHPRRWWLTWQICSAATAATALGVVLGQVIA